MMQQYQQPIIFDRGIPDNIAYADLFDLYMPHIEQAAKIFQYNSVVFFAPAWEEIYHTDDERKMSFAEARQFGEHLKIIYLNLGYKIIDLPLISPKLRVNFIIEEINQNLLK
jgi:predicted ATPase